MASVTILGCGITGLSAAHYLQQLLPAGAAAKVVVLEATGRVGGWLHSQQQPSGVLMEQGPHTLRATGAAGANTIALAEELGIEDKIHSVCFNHHAIQNRFIKVGGRLHRLPIGFSKAFKTAPPFTKPLILSILNDLRVPKLTSTDESLHSFVSRRFGHDVATYVIDPLARGVFAGNSRELSVKALAKTLHDWEQRYGGVVKGAFKHAMTNRSWTKDENLQCYLVRKARKERWAVWSLVGGIEVLAHALKDKVTKNGAVIKFNSKVDSLELNDDGSLTVGVGPSKFRSDHVISCLPSKQLSTIVGDLNPDLSTLLVSIPFATVAVVSLEYEGADLIADPAFGYLVPSCEPSKALGVIFDTCVFPQCGKTVLTVMMGGYWFQSLFGDNPSRATLLEAATTEVESTLGFCAAPCGSRVSVLRDCIPQYVVGHDETVSNARRLLKQLGIPLVLAGNCYDGVGVNDAILSAKTAVQSLSSVE